MILMSDMEEMAKEKEFNTWLSFSVEAVGIEYVKNVQLYAHSPPSWIYTNTEFMDWLTGTEQTSSLLWLSGTAGFGKSVLAAFLTTTLHENIESIVVPYFFCKDNIFLREARHILLNILQHLAQYSPKTKTALREVWDSVPSVAHLTAPIDDMFKRLFIPAVQSLVESTIQTICIIIDGLNECPKIYVADILKLLSLLQRTHEFSGRQTSAMPRVKVILSSQPTPEISRFMTSSKQVILQSQNNEQNIETYLKQVLDETMLERFRAADVDPFQFFRVRHQGMFLWVSTMLNLLERMDSDDDFQQCLKEVPEEINDVYLRGLMRLEKDLSSAEKVWVQEVISWAVMAKRNLLVSELAEGITLSRNMRLRKHAGTKLYAVEMTLSKCGAFIQVVSAREDSDQRFVTILHESFREFVLSADVCRSVFYIDPGTANAFIAMASLYSLSNYRLRQPTEPTLPLQLRAIFDNEAPLFNYATLYWPAHLEASSVTLVIREDTILLLCRFLQQKQLMSWFRNVAIYAAECTPSSEKSYIEAVFSGFQAVSQWVALQNLQMHVQGESVELFDANTPASYIPQDSSETAIFRRGFKSAVKCWLSGDPCQVEISMACFRIARMLNEKLPVQPSFESSDEVQNIAGQSDEIGQEFLAWQVINIGHGYRADFPQLHALRSAERHYRAGLGYSSGTPEVTHMMYLLSSTLGKLAIQSGALNDINESVAHGRGALGMKTTNAIREAIYLDNLSVALVQRALLTGSDDDLNESVELGRKALRMTVKEHPSFGMIASNLCNVLRHSYEWHQNISDINESVTVGRSSISTGPPNEPLPEYLLRLSIALLNRYDEASSLDYLNESIAMATKAFEMCSNQHPDFPNYANAVGMTLFQKAYSESPPNCHIFEEAISFIGQAVEKSNLEDARYGLYLYNMGSFLSMRSTLLSSMDDFDRAIHFGSMAVNLTPETHSNWTMYAVGSACSLRKRYDLTGNIDDLNNSIEILEKVVQNEKPYPISWNHVNQLGIALRVRFERTRSNVEDLDGAIKYATIAVKRGPNYSGNYDMLGIALLRKFEVSGSLSDIDHAIENLRKGVELAESKGGREVQGIHGRYHNLSMTLLSRSRALGIISDLEESIAFGKVALQTVPTDHSNVSLYANNLSMGLLLLFRKTSQVEHLVGAVEMALLAVDKGVPGSTQLRRSEETLTLVLDMVNTIDGYVDALGDQLLEQ